MKKYTKKNVLDYISGNDIEDFEIDELESNQAFMLDVIRLTKDKNIYNLCDDSIKKDVTFIEKLLEIFKNDFNFSLKIVTDFEKFSDNEYEIMNLYIILENNFKIINNEDLYAIRFRILAFYEKERMKYNFAIQNEKDDEIKKELGMEFAIALNEFENMPNVKDYFARKMLNEIYESYNLNLESYLHKRFKNKEELLKIGIKKYISNSIYGYDKYLAGYIECSNVSIDIEKKITDIINNWDNFNNNKYDIIIDIINNYAYECTFYSAFELTIYIAKEFNMPELIESFQTVAVDNDINFDIYNQYWYEMTFSNNNLEYRRELNNIKKIVSNYLKTLEEPDDYIENIKKHNAKVLSFDNLKKSKKV